MSDNQGRSGFFSHIMNHFKPFCRGVICGYLSPGGRQVDKQILSLKVILVEVEVRKWCTDLKLPTARDIV